MSTIGVLTYLRVRLGCWLALRGVLLIVTAIGGAALALGLADAMVELSDSVRAAAPWIMGLCGLAVLIISLVRYGQLKEQRLAREFESSDPTLGNTLTNAVSLAALQTDSPVTEALRQEAVERGRTAARRLPTWPVMRLALFRAMGAAFLVTGGWLLAVLVLTDLFSAVWPRFIDPTGDHPPYSRLNLMVHPGVTQVIYGGQLEVQAVAGGAPVEKMFLVTRTKTGDTKTAMFRAPEGTFFQTLANLREPVEYFVTDGRARSKRFPINIRYTPEINAIEVETVFPAYTGLPTCTVRLTETEMNLPLGTRVNFRAFSNRPLKSGALTLTPLPGGTVQTVTLTNATTESMVTGGFELNEPVEFEVDVRDVGGFASQESRRGRLGVIPDKPPQIYVLSPDRRAVATPDYRIPIRVQARDDYAVSRVVWFRGLNKSIERPFSMPMEMKTTARLVEATGEFNLSRLGVRPGDVIEYYFEAVDNDPRGPNVATSALQTLEIISREQYDEILRRMAAHRHALAPYEALDNWLRRLAERARGLDKKNDAKEAGALVDELGKFRDQANSLLAQPMYLDVEVAMRESMRDLDRKLSEMQRDLSKMARTGEFEPGALTYIAEELGRLAAREHTEVGEPFAQLLSVARLLAKADTFAALTKQQQELDRLLHRYEDHQGPLSRLEQMELQELAQKEQAVEKGVNDLVALLPDLAAHLPADEQFQKLKDAVGKFLDGVSTFKIPEDLGEATDGFSKSDAPRGITAAKRALENMLKLIGQESGMGDTARACLNFQPTLHAHIGKSLEQLMQALGGNGDEGESGDGYSMFDQSVTLYGPNALPPDRGGEEGSAPEPAKTSSSQTARVSDGGSTAAESAVKGRVRLQREARFPLQYREIVGDYFKAIAESQEE